MESGGKTKSWKEKGHNTRNIILCRSHICHEPFLAYLNFPRNPNYKGCRYHIALRLRISQKSSSIDTCSWEYSVIYVIHQQQMLSGSYGCSLKIYHKDVQILSLHIPNDLALKHMKQNLREFTERY